MLYRYINSSYLVSLKKLDSETRLYYYGARYYDPRISIFYGVDPLTEKYPNKTPYHYCSNNPVVRIDPDGKQDYGKNLVYAGIDAEIEKLKIEAAKPSAISVSLGVYASIILGGGIEFTGSILTKGPQAGTIGFYFSTKGSTGSIGAGITGGIEMTHLRGDERRFNVNSLEGESEQMSGSIGGPGSPISIGVSKSQSVTKTGDIIDGHGLDISKGKGSDISGAYEIKQTYHIGSLKIYSNNNKSYDPKVSAKEYYIKEYTNLAPYYLAK